MRDTRSMVVGLLLGPLAVVGCTPVVEVRHVVPGGLPLPDNVGLVRAGTFTVRSGPKGDFAAFMQTELDRRLADVPVGLGSAARTAEITEAEIARAGGTIDVETKDTSGQRTARRLNRLSCGSFFPSGLMIRWISGHTTSPTVTLLM